MSESGRARSSSCLRMNSQTTVENSVVYWKIAVGSGRDLASDCYEEIDTSNISEIERLEEK